MKSKLFIAMVAIAALLFVSCNKEEIDDKQQINAEITEKLVTDNNEISDFSKSTGCTSTYKAYYLISKCLCIPNNGNTVVLEIHNVNGASGTINLQSGNGCSYPGSTNLHTTSLPATGYKRIINVPRKLLGSDDTFVVVITPNSYATGSLKSYSY